MALTHANQGAAGGMEPLEASRLSRLDRREALLDAALELAGPGDVSLVSMEAVAERAGVSRPLVYKHFASRGDLLAAVYQREATLIHNRLAEAVSAADDIDGMFLALIRGVLDTAAERGHVFGALRVASSGSPELRNEQRSRDIETVRAFRSRAVRELGADRRRATTAMVMLLSAIDTVLAQWRARPTAEQAKALEEIYMAMVRGALADLHR